MYEIIPMSLHPRRHPSFGGAATILYVEAPVAVNDQIELVPAPILSNAHHGNRT